MKIKKSDKIKILTGKDKGKIGKVLQAFPKSQRLSIEGLNLSIKNVRANREGQTGQQIKYPASLHISNAMLICPKCSKPARVGYKILENKKKVRVCKKCNEVID